MQVLEADSVLGGASRTVRYDGFRFDLGGHRFYTKNQRVLDLVRELLGDELITVDRVSRIYLDGKFVDYPLSFFSALAGLGALPLARRRGQLRRAERCEALVRKTEERTFEQWVVNRFGRRLYEIYFKPYSEKVWGIPCSRTGRGFRGAADQGDVLPRRGAQHAPAEERRAGDARQPVHLPAPGLRPDSRSRWRRRSRPARCA